MCNRHTCDSSSTLRLLRLSNSHLLFNATFAIEEPFSAFIIELFARWCLGARLWRNHLETGIHFFLLIIARTARFHRCAFHLYFTVAVGEDLFIARMGCNCIVTYWKWLPFSTQEDCALLKVIKVSREAVSILIAVHDSPCASSFYTESCAVLCYKWKPELIKQFANINEKYRCIADVKLIEEWFLHEVVDLPITLM